MIKPTSSLLANTMLSCLFNFAKTSFFFFLEVETIVGCQALPSHVAKVPQQRSGVPPSSVVQLQLNISHMPSSI